MKKLIFIIFLLPFSLLAQCGGLVTNLNPQPLPDGLDYFYILDSNASLTLPGDSLSNPTGTDFDSFKSTILANIRTEATQIFANNWGITFTGMNTTSDAGDWDLVSQVIPLEYGQKILISGGETVPATGWTVYQAEWRIVSNTDFALIPSGVWVDDRLAQLGLLPGSSPIPVQLATSIAYGIFRVTCTDGSNTDVYDIRYTNIRPLFPDIIANFVNTTLPGTYDSTRAPLSYYLSLDDGLTWTGQGKGRFELIDEGATHRAVSKLIMKFYTP